MNSTIRSRARASRSTGLITLCLIAACGLPVAAASAEVITLRSGQVLGLPGLVGQTDDIITCGPSYPTGPISASPFTAADFNAAATNPAVVVNPHPAWVPGLTADAQARWIGVGAFPGIGYGLTASTLYRVPFTVTTAVITAATISVDWSSDDSLGDIVFGGGNPVGAYLRDPSGVVTALTPISGGNFTVQSQVLNYSILGAIGTGLNELFFYQRDQGGAPSGLIFSATIVIPAPGATGLVGLGGLVAFRRRR